MKPVAGRRGGKEQVETGEQRDEEQRKAEKKPDYRCQVVSPHGTSHESMWDRKEI